MRLADGTIFLDQPDFDAISGIVTLNWYWSGPKGSGEKHIRWRCYTPTEIVGLQWQFQSPGNVPDGGTQAGCPAVNMTVDDVTLVP